MVTKKIEKTDKYADYRYEIVTPEELSEAKWMVEQGFYKDVQDYIDSCTRMEIRIMKRQDAEKKKRSAARKRKRLESVKNDKAA